MSDDLAAIAAEVKELKAVIKTLKAGIKAPAKPKKHPRLTREEAEAQNQGGGIQCLYCTVRGLLSGVGFRTMHSPDGEGHLIHSNICAQRWEQVKASVMRETGTIEPQKFGVTPNTTKAMEGFWQAIAEDFQSQKPRFNKDMYRVTITRAEQPPVPIEWQVSDTPRPHFADSKCWCDQAPFGHLNPDEKVPEVKD